MTSKSSAVGQSAGSPGASRCRNSVANGHGGKACRIPVAFAASAQPGGRETMAATCFCSRYDTKLLSGYCCTTLASSSTCAGIDVARSTLQPLRPACFNRLSSSSSFPGWSSRSLCAILSTGQSPSEPCSTLLPSSEFTSKTLPLNRWKSTTNAAFLSTNAPLHTFGNFVATLTLGVFCTGFAGETSCCFFSVMGSGT